MTRAWWVLVLLLIISPLVSAGQTNPAKTSKLGQQVKQQPNTRGTKQQQQLKQQQQRTLGATVKQQQVNVKVAAAKKPGDEKIQLGAKITAGIKQGEKLEHKIHNLQQQLEDAQKKQAKLKEDQLRREKLKAEAEAKAKAEAPRVLIMQPVQTKAQLEKPTKSLRCGKVGNYYCINETTCCAKATGEWACCPKPSAICCQDKTHCCPQATTCDLKRGQCRGIGQTSPLMKKIGAVRLPKGSMVCPDHRSSCPEFYTCCPAQFGGFNCCPTPQAMCCPDKHHCCPHGSRCDPRHGRCDRGNQVAVPWFTKVPARPVAFGQIMCPGGQFECPTGSSCCRLKSGDWGCCPLPQAVCCEDGEHCCPRGYTCNQKMGSCQAQDEDALFVQWINVTDKHGMPPTPPNTICPSGKYKCPSDHTCCPRKGDLYGCCPFVEGTCCSDEKHCCPKGYECDLLKSKCVKGKGKVLLLSTLRASLDIRVPTSYQQLETPVRTEVSTCPDKSTCPTNTTCCQMMSGFYACCPMKNAVCCANKIHCCAEGQTCDNDKGTCVSSEQHPVAANNLIPTNNKIQAQNHTCPDKSICPANSTCCEMTDNYYACCPITNAVCCADRLHCCAPGQECDNKYQSCKSKTADSPLTPIKQTEKSDDKQQNSIFKSIGDHDCPDGKSKCPDETTCCQMVSGAYGCCPMPEAVCCPDKVHCCKHGQKCDEKGGACKGANNVTTPWQLKLPAQPIYEEQHLFDEVELGGDGLDSFNGAIVNLIQKQCPDKSSHCPDNNTCCANKKGAYDCCPVPEAICCSDKIHCCPKGYECDIQKGDCTSLTSDRRVPRLGFKVKKDKTCADNATICPEDFTCCKLSKTQYGCCPLPKAVCCSDMSHCCPEGFTCDAKKATCAKGTTSIPWFDKVPGRKVRTLGDSRNLAMVSKVVCPDQKSECPDGSTCCMLESGEYGCCPIPKAVCCKDHEHCCPTGFTCDVKAAKCTQGMTSIPWFSKMPSTSRQENVFGVKCAGSKATCPDKTTCCDVPGGGFGCCPIPEAVCCDDHKHCCPKGYVCDTKAGTCHNHDRTMVVPWLEKFSATLEDENDTPCPGGKFKCPGKSTCCSLPTGGFGCCPLPKATCCADNKHCCPKGYKCDSRTSTCSQGLSTLPWFTKFPAEPVAQVGDIQCPDKKSKCPDSTTCCQMESGNWACCPLPKAVCCSDQIHCCPNGYTCDVAEGTCKEKPEELRKVESSVAVHSVICPGGKYECPDSTTCCALSSGTFGCCPFPNAVCCTDHEHCCPSGYTCDTAEAKCEKDSAIMPWFDKIQAAVATARNVICPDKTSVCPDGSTCCQLTSGAYGCCPYRDAVCCSDHVHCCPSGRTCDVAAGTCKSGLSKLPWMEKIPALQAEAPAEEVKCPGGKASCPTDQTCCPVASGGYACCPLPKAVCCNDRVHCCPNGYTCDVEQETCKQGILTTPWVEKVEAKSLKTEAVKAQVVCPDTKSTCPEGSTCCKMASGAYGCCPIPKAVCCNDHVHCCPNGYTCDVAQGTCKQGTLTTPWLEKTPATPRQPINVVCPDKKSTCPEGSTCCEMASGAYGCCPIPKAVCCNDHEHCCPNGYTCDVAQETCKQGTLTIPWLKKTPSTPILSEITDVVCPDKKSACPEGSTCCLLKSGDYGCCPLPKAVCCKDQVHCCPNGYTCDATGACKRGTLTTPWLEKTPATPRQSKNVVCPDQKSTCPEGSTCCAMASGAYGCCPIPKAVCCNDHVHCCPNGYTCDVAQETCKQGTLTTPWLEKTPSTPILSEVTDVVCPDKKSACPEGSTCCLLKSGDYGCCPIPKAVCCPDKVHCCPKGYTCNKTKNGTSSCEKGSVSIRAHMYSRSRAKFPPIISIPWYTKVPGTPIKQDSSDKQQQQHNSDNQLKFEPLTSSLSDNSKIPNTLSGILKSNMKSVNAHGGSVNKMEAAYELESVTCPGGQFECPNHTTCCKMTTGQWGCCPMPHAVCCSDGRHCCPQGHKCDVKEQKCKAQSSLPIDLIELVANRKGLH